MPGINTQIKYKGLSFHIQTQDKGSSAKYIESFIYKSGKILYSQKTSYTSLLSSPDFRQRITQLMKKQHLAFINEISDGKCDRYLNLSEKPALGQKESLHPAPSAEESRMKDSGNLEVNLVQFSIPTSSDPLSFSLEIRQSSPSQSVPFSQITARAITEFGQEYLLFEGVTDEDGKLALGLLVPQLPDKKFTLSIRAEKKGFEPEEIKIPLNQI